MIKVENKELTQENKEEIIKELENSFYTTIKEVDGKYEVNGLLSQGRVIPRSKKINYFNGDKIPERTLYIHIDRAITSLSMSSDLQVIFKNYSLNQIGRNCAYIKRKKISVVREGHNREENLVVFKNSKYYLAISIFPISPKQGGVVVEAPLSLIKWGLEKIGKEIFFNFNFEDVVFIEIEKTAFAVGQVEGFLVFNFSWIFDSLEGVINHFKTEGQEEQEIKY
jgi:hypothetical protein